MRHHVRDAQVLGPQHLDDQRVDALAPNGLVWRRQVDQIAIVGDRVSDLQLAQPGLKLRGVVRGQRLGPPLVVVLGEELHAIAATGRRGLDRLVISAGNRLVGTENGHGARISEPTKPPRHEVTKTIDWPTDVVGFPASSCFRVLVVALHVACVALPRGYSEAAASIPSTACSNPLTTIRMWLPGPSAP